MTSSAVKPSPNSPATQSVQAASKIVANFSIPYVQYLNANAEIVNDLPAFCANDTEMLDTFRTMLLLRRFDHKVLMLHRTGKIGTYPGTSGQEAVGMGMAQCLQDNDVLVPYYRSAVDLYHRGARLSEILSFWIGDEHAMDFQNPKMKYDFPIPICIASQLPQAAGVATSFKLRKQKNRAVLTALGDGGTSEGDFYETLNVAGTWHLPLVIVINNNRWALTESNTAQSACQTLAQKAIAGGIEGLQVDGNDVIAVRAVVDEAMQKARNGGGPTLIEALTYRLCAHTTIDNHERYVDAEELKQANLEEPLIRLRTLLKTRGLLDDTTETHMENEIKDEIETEIEAALTLPPQPAESMFDFMYAELPEKLQLQRAEFIARKNKI